MRFRAIVLALAVIMLGAGCSRSNTTSEAGVLRYPLTIEPATLDPAKNEAADTGDMLGNVFEGLINLDERSQAAPGVADRWEISKDGRTYTFHINPKARFHAPYDRPVTAADVKYSFDRCFWPETKSPIVANSLIDVVGAKEVLDGKTRDAAGVKVIDPQTVSITVTKPNGYELMELTANIIVCPEALKKTNGEMQDTSAIGTGPFSLKEFQPNNRAVLVPCPDYWGGRPKLDRIDRAVVVDQQTAHIRYENGESDLSQISFSDFVSDQKNPKLTGQPRIVRAAGVEYLVMHPKAQPAFKDVRVRRAFASAIDRGEIERVAYNGLQQKAEGFLAPGVLGCSPRTHGIVYDPQTAKRLMAEAGFPGGKGFPKLTLVYQQGQSQIAAACQIMRDQLQRNLGITIDLQQRESATFFADTDKETIPFYYVGWMAIDPHDYLSLLMRTGAKYNALGFSDPKFDDLCDRGDAALIPSTRADYYQHADQEAVDQVAVIPVSYRIYPFLIKPYVQDLQFNLGGLMPHYHTRIARGR